MLDCVLYKDVMCFSATASFVAGGVLSATGGVLLARTRRNQDLPLASIPLLFGVQQIIEGIVWISFSSPAVNAVAAYAYTLFSHVLWPIFVPLSLLLVEINPARKKLLKAFLLVGTAIGLYLLYLIQTNTIDVQIMNCSIAYPFPIPYPFSTTAFYLVVICGSCFVSSHKTLRILGIAILISFAIATWFYTQTFISVWCFFAAILSIIIYWHFSTNRKV